MAAVRWLIGNRREPSRAASHAGRSDHCRVLPLSAAKSCLGPQLWKRDEALHNRLPVTLQFNVRGAQNVYGR